ncbi:hypothetical protein LSTR_LSTR007586 [Laodelphax striatellus]|uniref:Ig-like domain-containing protein n=1 Tax=Laodelphax striatellus TaxID=195883 RepID=A0A482WHM0_LAOST|nr:hypothetical protein LSTR_LSTR007586 [Laodelphax striatellus]
MVIFSTITLMLATLLASSTALSAASLDTRRNGFRWGWNHGQSKGDEEPPWEGPHQSPDELPATPGPLFEVTSASIVTRPGADVQLPCRVRNLGDKVVSWIRSKDLHILSSHVYIFTTDGRFSVSHPEGDSVSWDLRLRGARPADQGLYECQVNTEPKMKQAVMLTVNEMELGDSPYHPFRDEQIFNKTGNMARILGPREQLVHEGSTVTLTCEVRTSEASPDPPPPSHHHAKPTRLVDWLFEGQLLTFQASRGGISVDTERNGLQVWSRLTLGDVTVDDTGRYTCKPMQAPSAVVTLVVVEGETMEAMQGSRDQRLSDSSSASNLKSMSMVSCIFLLIFLQLV